MATLESNEANIIDAEAPNWRLIVYPILVVLIVVVGGFGYYYYLQNQREQLEATARVELLKATTPEAFLKVATDYPHTDQATLALFGAANASFIKDDFDAAIADYRKIAQNDAVDPGVRDSAQLGLASCLEAGGKADNAITALQEVAQRGTKSPYAPFAYNAIARIYDERGDKDNERKTLTDAASLDPASAFTKQAQFKLKELNAAQQPPMTVNVPAPAPAK